MAVAVTNSKLTAYNTAVDRTANPATATDANTAEVFTITPTVADSRYLMEVSVADTHGTVTAVITAGAMHNGKAISLSFAQNKTHLVMLDGSMARSATGTIVITFTPADGKKLLTDHALSVAVIELPG